MSEENSRVPIWNKYALTVKEAAEYFNIGEKKLRKLVDDYGDTGFAVWNGTKVLIKRRSFEKFLDNTSGI